MLYLVNMKHLVAPAVNVLIIKDNMILMSRRANTGWLDGHLCLPGGHVENEETPTQALVREIKEELGVAISEAELEFVCVAYNMSSPTMYSSYEFKLVNTQYEFKNTEPEKCSELVWVDTNKLPKETIGRFRLIIEAGYRNKQPYIVTSD